MGIAWFLFIFYFFSSYKGTYGLDAEIVADLKTPNRNFGFKTMNYFIQLANKQIPNLDMIEMSQEWDSIRKKKSKKTPIKEKDVQILYGDWVGPDKALNYIVVYYTNKKLPTLVLYDSMDRPQLSEDQKRKVVQRHNEYYNFRKPSTRHISISSTGPLSIAYATLLIFGKDVENYRLLLDQSNEDPTIHLREHILKMFETGKLMIFPEADFSAPLISNQIMKELISANEPFSDVTINYFIQMVRLHSEFDMISLLNYDSSNAYEPICKFDHDIQILYGDNSKTNGYYILIRYVGGEGKKVYVYDSLMKNKLSTRNMEIINKRYPSHQEIVYGKPLKKSNATEEQARISSGAVSIEAALVFIRGSSTRDKLKRYQFFVKEDYTRYYKFDHISYDNPERHEILSVFKENDLWPGKW